MARHSSRLLGLVRWQYIRWGLAIPSFALALWACNSHDLQVPKPNPQQETDFSILVSPERMVDILFMIDNSPSMDPKQAALAENFPKMIDVLANLPDGMPDVHVGVVSSDMGAGGGEAGGNCSVVLGNQGILWGNDPDKDPLGPDNNKYATVKHLKNSAGAEGCGLNTGARWLEDIRAADGINRNKNYTGKLTDVFSCLAKGVGTGGCGYEHQLQSVRVALNPAGNINPQNFNFLRPKAFLAVVLITDEDDCSADPDFKTNDSMFYARPNGETASLRCAARGHVCNGQPIPNYDPENGGYTAKEPFVAKFADCEAKDDDPKDRNYKKLPLIRIREMIDSVNQVKTRPSEQILVSGIIGWPEGGKLDGLEYRIDKDPTSVGEQKNFWDYMPFCELPDQKAADGNIYKAYGGYRLKKFIDGFDNNGQVFSLCNTTAFPKAMEQIGTAIASKIRPGCVGYPLIDTVPDDPTRPETLDVQPECQVMDKISCDKPTEGNCLASGYEEQPIRECINPNTGAPLNPADPDKKAIPNEARPCWYLIYDKNEATGCPTAFRHQRITALRKDDGIAPPGTLLDMKCLTCASPPKSETESSCPALGAL